MSLAITKRALRSVETSAPAPTTPSKDDAPTKKGKRMTKPLRDRLPSQKSGLKRARQRLRHGTTPKGAAGGDAEARAGKDRPETVRRRGTTQGMGRLERNLHILHTLTRTHTSDDTLWEKIQAKRDKEAGYVPLANDDSEAPERNPYFLAQEGFYDDVDRKKQRRKRR